MEKCFKKELINSRQDRQKIILRSEVTDSIEVVVIDLTLFARPSYFGENFLERFKYTNAHIQTVSNKKQWTSVPGLTLRTHRKVERIMVGQLLKNIMSAFISIIFSMCSW